VQTAEKPHFPLGPKTCEHSLISVHLSLAFPVKPSGHEH
jgi:hypothetical protein